MEFNMNRGAQPAPARATSNGPSAPSSATGKPSKSGSWKASPKWLRVIWVALLFAVTLLAVSILFLLYFGGSKESNYVDTKSEQAVFLTNGQVYFGKIKSVNKQFVDLKGIYYLNVNQQVQPNQTGSTSNANANQSVSLVKLGCELHGPMDEMIINRDQITFWENLKSDGQVTKAISTWLQQNPKGQTCATTTNTTTTKP